MKHAELFARLEAATRGRRSLGRDILVALEVVREVEPSMFYGIGNEDVWHYGDAAESEGCWQMLPDPTTSLGAALALACRVLPGWSISMAIDENHRHPVVVLGRSYPKNATVAQSGNTLCLCLCIAILRALDSQSNTA